MKVFNILAFTLLVSTAILFTGTASAEDITVQGIPLPWQIGYQDPASPIMRDIAWFHDIVLLPMMIGISLFVAVLLAYIGWRFSEKRNPVPAKFTHNTMIEVIWTAIPVLILLALIVPSMSLLYRYETVPEGTNLTIKATGFQWAWNYDYPDYDGLNFDAYMLEESDLTNPAWRNLETDNYLVVPTNTNIRLQVTTSDVIHAFAIPALGIKKDAIPGRLNELPMYIEKEGLYFGQCSEICGVGHAYMPITIHAVSPDEFKVWANNAQSARLNGTLLPKAGHEVKLETAQLSTNNE